MQATVNITILGSTGSIGLSTLDVISRYPNKYQVFALTANSSVDKLYAQCLQYQPRFAVMRDNDSAEKLQQRLLDAAHTDTEVLSGESGLLQVAGDQQVDYVMAAIVGAAGLLPTLEAAKQGKRVLLANKEALVMSGQLFMDAVKDNNATLLPIDSEHNAIWQCLPQHKSRQQQDDATYLESVGVRKIWLTASGGPFRKTPLEALQNVTPEQACAHPNWDMGRKISVDSATMMNKGLEVIEACWLFATSADHIQVVVHPESVIHSMVAYSDGSVLAQLGNPDMRTPIAHALGWPERIESGVEPLDIFAVAQLNFVEPDTERFPCLDLAYQAINTGGTATAVLNAANEIAVDAFLSGQIQYMQIADVVAQTLGGITVRKADSLDVILQADNDARQYANNYINSTLQ